MIWSTAMALTSSFIPLTLFPLFQSHWPLCSFFPLLPAWLAPSLGLCLIFTLSDRSLLISLYKITLVHCHCVSLMLFFLAAHITLPDICIHLFVVCFLSLESRLIQEDRDFCLFYSLLYPQCLELSKCWVLFVDCVND